MCNCFWEPWCFSRLFVVGEEPLRRELRAAGFSIVDDAKETEAVIASFDRTFDYGKLQTAFDAIRGGQALAAHDRGGSRPRGSARRALPDGRDLLETDIKMGSDAGMPTALTLTGATDVGALEASTIQPTYVVRRLDELLSS